MLLALGAVPVLAEPSDGTVSGQVVNKTAGGSTTQGTPVLLVAFGRKEQAPLGQRSTQADADGRYAFNALDRDPNIVYITLARFQTVNYPTNAPFQLQDQSSAQADITVYDATSADDAIQLENLNLLVMGADQGMLQGMEMGALINTSDRTFITANPQDQVLAKALKFALPSGAINVQMQAGFDSQDVIPGSGGVQVTTPVQPGRHQFALSFQVPYSGSSVDVSLQMPYPAASYSVYLPGTGIRLDNSPLTPGGPTQLGGQTYSLFTAANLPKATLVGGQLSGLGGTGALSPNPLPLISLGVVVFVLGGGTILLGGRLRSGATANATQAGHADDERLELVVRLAALDERFAAGEMNQADYERERERGKQRLRELTLAVRRPNPLGV
jgi:hypothetical protein